MNSLHQCRYTGGEIIFALSFQFTLIVDVSRSNIMFNKAFEKSVFEQQIYCVN